MISEETASTPDLELLERITFRAFAQAVAMIHIANHRKDKEQGDPKVGGHPASCASSLHLLAALHLHAREPQDFVCCKPHAAPMDHAFHHLLQLFRHGDEGKWFDEAESRAVMERFAQVPQPGAEDVFQSYHARSRCGLVPLPALGLGGHPAGRFGVPGARLPLHAADHRWDVPENAHFWSLIGDSEFREGSLLEAMPDAAERMLGNVTWIIDYNRQNLDGTRIPNERGLALARLRPYRAHGDRQRLARHPGATRRVPRGRVRARGRRVPAAVRLRVGVLTDYDFQMLALFKREAGPSSATSSGRSTRRRPGAVLDTLEDDEVVKLLLDLGGH